MRFSDASSSFPSNEPNSSDFPELNSLNIETFEAERDDVSEKTQLPVPVGKANFASLSFPRIAKPTAESLMAEANQLYEAYFQSKVTSFLKPMGLMSKQAKKRISRRLGQAGLNPLTQQQKQMLNDAVDAYKRALALDVSLSQAYVRMANCMWEQRAIQLEAALFYCCLAIKHNPKDAEAHLYQGYFFQRLGKLDEAMESFGDAIQLAPLTLPQARLAMGNTLLLWVQNHSAKQLADNPFTPTLKPIQQVQYLLSALLYFTQGLLLSPLSASMAKKGFLAFHATVLHSFKSLHHKVLLGSGRMSQLLMGQKGALKFYKVAHQVNPEDMNTLLLLASAQETEGKLAEATRTYQQALKVSFEHPFAQSCEMSFSTAESDLATESNRQNLGLIKKLIHLLLVQNRHNEVIQVIHHQVSTTQLETDFELLYCLGTLYVEQQDYIQALYYLRLASELNPTHPGTHSNLAYCMFRLGDTEGAVQAYQRAVSFGTNPEWTATIAQTLGTILFRAKNDYAGALEMFHLAEDLSPSATADNHPAITNMMVDIYTEMGELDAAIALYQQQIEMGLKSADAYTYYGYLLWQANRFDEAITAYNSAIALDTQNPITFNNLGVIYLDEKAEPEKAIAYFQQSIDLDPDYAMAHFNIGRSYARYPGSDNRKMAAKSYQEALRLNEQQMLTGQAELDPVDIQNHISQLFSVE